MNLKDLRDSSSCAERVLGRVEQNFTHYDLLAPHSEIKRFINSAGLALFRRYHSQ